MELIENYAEFSRRSTGNCWEAVEVDAPLTAFRFQPRHQGAVNTERSGHSVAFFTGAAGDTLHVPRIEGIPHEASLKRAQTIPNPILQRSEIQRRHQAASTYDRYKGIIDTHLTPTLGAIWLQALRESMN